MKRKCILFAGPPGSSKTPIAYYLSWNFNLPIFSNDSIRSEVKEEYSDNETRSKEFYKRRDERFHHIITSGKAFIYDASIDRRWEDIKKALQKKQL